MCVHVNSSPLSHQKFLSSLDPPLDIPEEKVLRWHPAFQLDMVPDIEEAELPKPPLKGTIYCRVTPVIRTLNKTPFHYAL